MSLRAAPTSRAQPAVLFCAQMALWAIPESQWSNVAGRDETRPEVLRLLARDPSVYTAGIALINPRLPPDEIAYALLYGDAEQRYTVHQNPAIPEAALAEATRMAFASADGQVGRTHGMPVSRVRQAELAGLLQHPNARREFLERAARSGVEGWMLGAARNPALPADLAVELFASAVMPARVMVLTYASLPLAALADHVWEAERTVGVLMAAARRVRGPVLERVLTQLSTQSDSVHVRMLIAKRSADAARLARLCWDPESRVRLIVAENPAARDVDLVAIELQR